jgi:hypothetical protein
MDLVSQILASRLVQTLALTFITVAAAQLALAHGKLRWSLRHLHWYKLPGAAANGDALDVVTQELWFQNTGRAPVEDVEIVFNWKPQHYELWGPRAHSEALLADSRFILRLPSLAAKEFVALSLLDTRELPAVVNVRSKNSNARQLPIIPVRQFPQWFYLAATLLMLLGLSTAIYLMLWIVSPMWQHLPTWSVG